MLKQALTSFLTVITVSAIAQSGFEGTIVMETTTAKTNEEAKVTIHIKDSNSRMDFESITEGYDTQYSVFVDDKGVDLVSQGHITKLDPSTIMPPKGNMQQIIKEGGVEKYGYPCTHYQFSDGEQTVDYWLTTTLGVGMNDFPAIFQQGMPKPESGNIEGVCVAMTVVDRDGNSISTQKLVSVNRGRVEEEVFERK